MFFKERWFGFDDGLYSGARLLEILSARPDANAALKALPNAVSTPELNLKMNEGEPFELVRRLPEAASARPLFDGAQAVITLDGVRIEYADGFGLARPVQHHAGGRAALRGRRCGRRWTRSSPHSGAAINGVWPGLNLPF